MKRSPQVHLMNDNKAEYDYIDDCGVDLTSQQIDANGVELIGSTTSSDEEFTSSGSSSKDEDESDEIIYLKTR